MVNNSKKVFSKVDKVLNKIKKTCQQVEKVVKKVKKVVKKVEQVVKKVEQVFEESKKLSKKPNWRWFRHMFLQHGLGALPGKAWKNQAGNPRRKSRHYETSETPKPRRKSRN